MQKEELKSLVKKYFNLTEITNSPENNEPIEVKSNFATATLADGTAITNMVEGDFAVGQELHVITEEGEHVIAPEGEHTTDSGIVITVDGQGSITGVKYPDQEGEGSLEEASKEEMSSDDEEKAEESADDSEKKTELAEEALAGHEDEDSMNEHYEDGVDVREEVISAIAEVVMPELEGLKSKMAEHEEKLAEHEEKMNDHYSKTPASESKTATTRFSKNNYKLTENEGPKHNKKRYELALARLNNKNQ